MVKCMLDDYLDKEFQQQVCVGMNTQALRIQYPDLGYFDKNKVYQNILFVGATEYGRFARHYYAATWTSAENQEKRMKEIEQMKSGKGKWKVFKWHLTNKIRNPKLVKYIENHPNFFTKILHFLIFDLIDCGLWYYIKRVFTKIFRRDKKKKQR